MSDIERNLSFSIVTVVYNGEKEIERTIESCLSQDYKNMEYIIIDGASKDRTKEIVNKYHDRISIFISEPDNGIYDAMNKAIKLSKCEWMIFMNCGDTFYNNQVLTDVAAALIKNSGKPDIIYGNTLFRYKSFFLKSIPLPISRMEKEMVFCHQSSFVRSEIAKENMFDLQFKFAADYIMMQRLFFQNREFFYLDMYISVFNQIDGSSIKNFTKSARERYSVHNNSKTLQNKIKLELYIIRMAIGLTVKSVIPEALSEKIFVRKYSDRIVEYKKND